jgi:hypothetical protein
VDSPLSTKLPPISVLPTDSAGHVSLPWYRWFQGLQGTNASTGVAAGTYGDGSHVGQFTVGTDGRLTFAQNVPIASGAGGTVTAVAINSLTGTLAVSGSPITTAGVIELDVLSAPKWTTARNLSFTGDVTGTGSVDGSADVATALTLATVNANVGTFGDSTHIPQFTVNAKGLITAASNIAITVPVGANPTATAGPTAINGSAATFMRSDAAPAVQKGSASQFGIVQVDGTTITASGGVISAAGASGGSGLFYPVMSAVPTIASTGLSAHTAGSPTLVNTAMGLNIGAVAAGAAWTNTVPAAPYSITALFLLTASGTLPGLGWTDGTKFQFMYMFTNGNLNVQSNSTFNTFAATNYNTFAWSYGVPTWFKIRDDGTTVYFMVSQDGVTFQTVYSVAKSAGFLGSSGYSHIAVTVGSVTIASWAQGT